MNDFFSILEHFQVGATVRAILLVILGLFVARMLRASLTRAFSKRLTRQQSMLVGRFTFYFVLALFFTSAVQQLGFHITALLGATGIATVAIGVASQTSMANLISGVFIIGEKPFEIGDTIKVNDIEGEVLSIDLLSVKIRTHDNRLTRIPNEILVKSPIINVSYFPERRIDLFLNIAYKEDLAHIKNLLFTTAQTNRLSLKDPAPAFLIKGFGDYAIQIKFSVWASQKNFNEVKNSIQEDIKIAFEQAGIEIPENRSPLATRILS
jgi:small-conductance mechanosensitive channel